MALKIKGNNIHNISVNKTQEQTTTKKNDGVQQEQAAFELTGSKVSFGAIYPIKNKKVNIEAETNKLLKQLDEILSSDDSIIDLEEFEEKVKQNLLNQIRSEKKKKREIEAELDRISKDTRLNQQQRLNLLYGLKKDVERLGKLKYPKHLIPKINPDADKIDFLLLNKFKTAILEGNYDLETVYQEHFSDLGKIRTIKSLNKKYPKIKTPMQPEKVIAKKIIATITRDTYLKLDELMSNDMHEEAATLINEIADKHCEQIAKKFNLDVGELSQKLVFVIGETIIENFLTLKKRNQINSVPENRKTNDPMVTQNDINLLSVNMDKFVLSVVKQHYLEGKKLNDITYEENGTKINVGNLKESEYKFEKFQEKFKKIISDAMIVKYALRDYKWFNEEELKKQLEKNVEKEYAQNDKILENIMAFHQSKFTQEDTKYLIQFLELLDKVEDGEMAIDDALEKIKEENIRPRETERLNELEVKETAEKLRIEKEKKAALKELKNKFDDAINILYLYNLNTTAQICAKYRPKTLDNKEVEKANFIIQTITNNCSEDKINKSRIQKTIARKEAYDYYNENNPTDPLFKKAQNYAKNKENVDYVDTVGQYLINAEIVEKYPDSKSMYKDSELLEKLVNRFPQSADSVVEALCKFDEYQDLNDYQKEHICEYIKLFNQDDATDKIMLKHIIENYYANIDTVVEVKGHGNTTEAVYATFAAGAKQGIIEHYNFPKCIELLTDFEEATSMYATEKGKPGIKKLTRNNKNNKYKAEVKIMGYDHRLFATGNDYYFDIYSKEGLH